MFPFIKQMLEKFNWLPFIEELQASHHTLQVFPDRLDTKSA